MMDGISRRRFIQTAGTAVVTGALLRHRAVKAAALPKESAAARPQTVVIEGFPWGPGVTATILELEQPVRADSVRPQDFAVTEVKQAYGRGREKRQVTGAYACSREGKPADGDSRWVRLELRCTPEEGSPFYYDILASRTRWCDPYRLEIELAQDAALVTAQGSEIKELCVEPQVDFSCALIPPMDPFDLTGVFTGSEGRTLRYASYKPAEQEGPLPLVIWLHGAGEGGTDPSILLLRNEVTRLAGPEFQQAMGGAAYILAPQTPTFWMEYNEKGSWQDNPGTGSVYTTALKELIDAFVQQNPGIDTQRILVGGCSNGGYMTMDLILRWPEYFAAAFPICEAYRDEGITDEALASIRELPLWFVYAQNDHTVPPAEYEQPTIARLRAMQADLHTSIFADVHDTTGMYREKDGTPYQYKGHWSWVYFFQNQCVDDATGENLWDWLGKQRRKGKTTE